MLWLLGHGNDNHSTFRVWACGAARTGEHDATGADKMGGVVYRLDPALPIGEEVRRVLGEQLRRASEDLARPSGDGDAPGAADDPLGPAEAPIHQARKRIKKARSLLRLARADFGAGIVKHAQGELRDGALRLSTQRDLDSQAEVVGHLIERTAPGTEDRIVAQTLRVLLKGEAAEARAKGGLTWGAARTVARRLEETAVWLERLPSRADGWDAIGPGLERQYAAGRKTFRSLPPDPDIVQIHEWRKRVKDLWYHERLLRRLWTEGQRPVVNAGSHLSDLLGIDHDLGLLEDRIEGRLERTGPDPIAQLPREIASSALAMIEAERERLQAEWRQLGPRLYAEQPKAWAKRHEALWEVAVDEAARAAALEALHEAESDVLGGSPDPAAAEELIAPAQEPDQALLPAP